MSEIQPPNQDVKDGKTRDDGFQNVVFELFKYCRKCGKKLPVSDFFTDEAIVCKKCQLTRIKQIL